MTIETDKAVIYRAIVWGKERFFITWPDLDPEMKGGHEIGPVCETSEKLLNKLLEIMELPD